MISQYLAENPCKARPAVYRSAAGRVQHLLAPAHLMHNPVAAANTHLQPVRTRSIIPVRLNVSKDFTNATEPAAAKVAANSSLYGLEAMLSSRAWLRGFLVRRNDRATSGVEILAQRERSILAWHDILRENCCLQIETANRSHKLLERSLQFIEPSKLVHDTRNCERRSYMLLSHGVIGHKLCSDALLTFRCEYAMF
jgi:hypothetical protein